jgi:predicted ABC-type exoprotein transport system permease subunit
VDYKTKVLSRNRFILNTVFWLLILVGLIAARFIYLWLYNHHHTTTSSMSLFDVIEFTAIIYLLFGLSRARARLTASDRRFREMHQELSIRLSEKEHK